MEIFYLFYVRNAYGTSITLKAIAGTRAVWLTIGIVVLAQFAVTYLPVLQEILGTRAVPLGDGLAVVAVGFALLVVLETEKQLRLRLVALRHGDAGG